MNKIILTILLIAIGVANLVIFNDIAKEKNILPPTVEKAVVLDDYSEDILSLTNAYRNSKGKQSLLIDYKLTESAQNKADGMCEQNYFAHDLPDGKKWFTTIENSGYEYAEAGENLGRGYETGAEVVQAWIDSPEHESNLAGDYEDIGIAVSECGGKYYSVQEFAKP